MNRPYEEWFIWLDLEEVATILYDALDEDYLRIRNFYHAAAGKRAKAWEEEERYWARKQGRRARSAHELEGGRPLRPEPLPPGPQRFAAVPGLPIRTGLPITAAAAKAKRQPFRKR